MGIKYYRIVKHLQKSFYVKFKNYSIVRILIHTKEVFSKLHKKKKNYLLKT